MIEDIMIYKTLLLQYPELNRLEKKWQTKLKFLIQTHPTKRILKEINEYFNEFLILFYKIKKKQKYF